MFLWSHKTYCSFCEGSFLLCCLSYLILPIKYDEFIIFKWNKCAFILNAFTFFRVVIWHYCWFYHTWKHIWNEFNAQLSEIAFNGNLLIIFGFFFIYFHLLWRMMATQIWPMTTNITSECETNILGYFLFDNETP